MKKASIIDTNLKIPNMKTFLKFLVLLTSIVLLISLPMSLLLGLKFGRWKKEKEKVIISESKGEVSLKVKNYEVEILEGVEIGVLSVEVGKILNRGNVSEMKLGVGEVENRGYIEGLDLGVGEVENYGKIGKVKLGIGEVSNKGEIGEVYVGIGEVEDEGNIGKVKVGLGEYKRKR